MSYLKYSRRFKVELWTQETHSPVEGHMGQMLLHLRSAHKSHKVGENENKWLCDQFLLQHHSDLLYVRYKAIHHHSSLKTVNYTPRLQAAEDKKRDRDDIQMARDWPYRKWKRRQIKCIQGSRPRDLWDKRLAQVSVTGRAFSAQADGCRRIFNQETRLGRIQRADAEEKKGRLSRCLQGIQLLPSSRAVQGGGNLFKNSGTEGDKGDKVLSLRLSGWWIAPSVLRTSSATEATNSFCIKLVQGFRLPVTANKLSCVKQQILKVTLAAASRIYTRKPSCVLQLQKVNDAILNAAISFQISIYECEPK